jgi:hypothetical protein
MITLVPIGRDERMNIGVQWHNNTVLQAAHSSVTVRCFRQCMMAQHNVSGSTQQHNNKMIEAVHNSATTG